MYRVVLRDPCRSALQRKLQQQSQRTYQQSSSNSHGLPPNVQEAGFGKYVFFLSPFIVVGGAITYAKYDPKFRKTLEDNVPGASSIIKVALQEEKPFSKQLDSISNQYNSVAKSVGGVTSTITGLFGNSSTENTETKSEKSEEAPKPKATASSPTPKEPIVTKTVTKERKSSTKASKPTPPASKPVETLPTSILELEKAVEVAASLAIKEYNKANEIVKNFSEEIREVVDKAVERGDLHAWNILKNKTSARDFTVETAERLAHEALDKIEKCEIALSQAANANNHDEVLKIRDRIKNAMAHINTVKDELYKNKDLAAVSEKYWRNVEKARNYFIDEMESIFPGINLSEKKLNLSKDDMDMFIMYAYTHVLAHQKELQRLQTDGELRLKRAIEAARGDGDSEAAKAQLEYLLEKERHKLAIEHQKKVFEIYANAEKQLRQQLKQQAEAHVDHLNDALNVKENAMRRNFKREMEDKLAAERANYKLQLASMLGKMRGMDAALQERAESERSAHQAQALWAACQALWSSIRNGEPGQHWKSKLRPLRHEIAAISKVAEGDELVGVVLKNLPTEARERGVFPEDALRERFLKVESLARRVALVPEGGASIPMYFLSYLQSIFILKPDNPISDDELQNKKFDYSKLDTYDILNRARYYVDRGELLQAVKYMNLLQGAPRKIACDWLNETRLLLETQQAANTLMAHAAASGLLYL